MFEDVIRRLRLLIFTRALIVTLLLGSLYIFQIGYGMILTPIFFSYFIATLYFLTILYAIALRWVKTVPIASIFVFIQLVFDLISETVLVYLTGGIESWFSFTFLLTIISASIILHRRASYYTATLGSILYGFLLGFQFFHLTPGLSEGIFAAKDYLYNIFAHILAFYLVAFLSGNLSQRLYTVTQTLQKRDIDLDNLRALSRDIIESMPSGIFTMDLNGKIIIFNSAAERITGNMYADAIGKTPQDIFPFLENIDLGELLERIEGEIEIENKTVSIGIRFSALKNNSGMPTGMIGVFQDLTKLKAMEKEIQKKEKWAFIGELSALIAHELRNPLASLKASIEMLREKKVSSQYADQLMDIALSEMDRLNGIVTDFLLFAKPQQLSREYFDLHQPLKEVFTLLRTTKTDKENVTITENFIGKLFITGDPKQLKQVFWNLGNNAMDAVSDGEDMYISTKKRNKTVEIVFRDTGAGISKENIEKIFFPFFTTKEKGTGLGLAIAQRITEEHGGKIVVESNGIGTGATFRVILPLSNMKGNIYNDKKGAV